MDNLLKKLTEGAADAGALARSLAENGIKSVSEFAQGTKIFGALSAGTNEQVEFDETHYVLVPVLGPSRDYAIYTKRILPPDTGATNSLPKARIFHVPDASGKELLEQQLVANLVSDRVGGDCEVGESELADTLEKVADQIDGEVNKISGGLLLIGTAVAFVNPIVGVGIAAKGLLPSIGSKASKVGAEYVGNKLRDWNKSSAMSRHRKDASKEVRMLKPRIYANPIVRSLDAVATNRDTDFDPGIDARNWVDEFESLHHYAVTAEAIREVYRELLDTKELENYQPVHLEWLRSFVEAPTSES